jgi:Tfp pilus assembly protein PilN
VFRFTIRDVLWLTVVVALLVGWTLQTRRLAELNKEQEALRKRLENVKEIARDTAQLHIEEDEQGLRVMMPRGWPKTLVDQWEPIPPPANVPAGADYPVAKRR